MISADCRIESFLAEVHGKKVTEVIILANQEATEAERVLLHRGRDRKDIACPVAYVESLKEFIRFMRCAVLRNRAAKDKNQRLFQSYLKSVASSAPRSRKTEPRRHTSPYRPQM
jgi:hypothetical protein